LLKEKRTLESCDRLIAGAFGPAIRVLGLAVDVLQFLARLAPTSPVTSEQQQREEALWWTLCCDLTPSGERAPARQRGFQILADGFRTHNNNGQVYSWFKDRELWEQHHVDARELGYAMRKFTFGRSLCITWRGRLGSVPHGSRVGDEICLFREGRVPL
jgi:hypothetical protein